MDNGMISVSMMCVHLGQIKEYLDAFKRNNIEYLHIDVMDGSFVPNFTLYPDYVKQLRDLTDIPFDFHFMIEKPEERLQWFDIREGDYAAVHYESTKHIAKCLQYLRSIGAKPILAINPGTPICVVEEAVDFIDGVLVMTVNPGFAGQKLVPNTVDKARRLRKWLDENGHEDIIIETDGNMSNENCRKLYEAGARMFVAGTSSLVKPQVEGIDETHSRSVYIVQGGFFTLFMRIRKSGAEFPLRHRFAYIFTLFFSIKSTFPIMGIYHSHRLQKRIYYHASHELHSTLFQVCRYPIGPFVGSFIALVQYFSVSKPAKIIIKAPLLLHNIPKYSCIRNTRPNFQLISHNRTVRAKLCDLLFVISTDLIKVKFIISSAEILTLVQYALPRKPSLKRLQHKHLKQIAVISPENAPFLVMIFHILWIFQVAPFAPVHISFVPSLSM